MNDPTSEHPGRYRDAHAVLDLAETTGGLPFPSISRDIAAFNFTHITHARDTAESVALAETILAYGLDVTFTPKDTPRIGSAAHYILAAFMPSGLEVDIVARAQHMADRDAGKPRAARPELAAAS